LTPVGNKREDAVRSKRADQEDRDGDEAVRSRVAAGERGASTPARIAVVLAAVIAVAAAATVDEVLDVLVSSLLDLIENEPGFFVLLLELFTAGRRHPEIQREVAEMFRKTRGHVAVALEGKESEGVISLRYGADATVAYLFAIADGFAVQVISDPERDHSEALDAGREAARHLLVAD
jgi:hypothetical protein